MASRGIRARFLRDLADAGGQPVSAVGGIATPDRMDGDEGDCYYAGQLLASLGIAESWPRDGDRSIGDELLP